MVVVPDVNELEVEMPTFQVVLLDPFVKLLHERVEGKVIVTVVEALTLFLLRMSRLALEIENGIVLLIS